MDIVNYINVEVEDKVTEDLSPISETATKVKLSPNPSIM